jgi:hypothetical protein
VHAAGRQRIEDMNAGELRGTIRGIVHPTGMRVYPGRSFWTRRIVFQMHVWRLDGQLVQTKPLLVALEAFVGTTWRWRQRLAPGAAISFASTGLEAFGRGALQLPLSRYLGPADDRELLDVEASRRLPDFLDTPEFGRLSANAGMGDYSGRCAWHGTTLELDISGDEDGNVASALDHARTLLATWEEWEDKLRDLVARELLPLWLDWHADEAPIDADTLYGRLTLERICVMDDGEVQLSMDAREQFTDHEIIVDGTVAGGPTEIYPEG